MAQSRLSLVSSSIAHSLGHSGVGSRFSEILTASYNHRSLTTDVEFEIIDDGLLPDVVIGSNWIAAWRIVGQENNAVYDLRPISSGECEGVLLLTLDLRSLISISFSRHSVHIR